MNSMTSGVTKIFSKHSMSFYILTFKNVTGAKVDCSCLKLHMFTINFKFILEFYPHWLKNVGKFIPIKEIYENIDIALFPEIAHFDFNHSGVSFRGITL